MDLAGIIQKITVFAQNNILVSVVIGLFMIFLLFRHPKVLLTVAVFLMVAYGLASLFEKLAQYGLG